MKTTKIMLAFVATFLLTAMTLGFIVFLLSDPGTTYRETMQSGGIWMAMLVFGWVPSVIVCTDLDDVLTT